MAFSCQWQYPLPRRAGRVVSSTPALGLFPAGLGLDVRKVSKRTLRTLRLGLFSCRHYKPREAYCQSS
jgi:hypothetical protein